MEQNASQIAFATAYDVPTAIKTEPATLAAQVVPSNSAVYNPVSPIPAGNVSTGQLSSQISLVNGFLQSSNFKTGSTGWQIDAVGNVEFNSGTFRGTLVANSISIPDTVTANSFHVDTSGNAWWGATAIGSAIAKVLDTGAATFTNIKITGLQSGSSIDGQYLGSATVVGTALANATITAAQIANATITTTQISATAGIVGGQIALATVAGGNIASTTITAGNIANLTITASQIANLTISSGKVNTALMSYSHNLAFSVASSTQVNWATGTLTTSDGTAYTISAGNTGTMSAKTFVYLDTAVSATVLQTTTTFSTAVGDGKMLIAVAQNNTTEAVFQVFNGIGGMNLAGGNIVAGSITANEIAASTITASQIAASTITANEIAASTITSGKMNVSQLSAISADLGAITAGSIVMPSGGLIRSGQTAYATGTGFYLGNDSGTPKFSIGDTTNYLTWDGTDFIFTGQSRITLKAATMFEDLTRYPTFGSGSATIDAGLYLRAHTVPTANNYKELIMTMGPSAGILIFADTTFSAFVHMRQISGGAGDNGNFYIGVSQQSMAVGDGTTMTATQRQYGFKVLKVDGVMTLYATHANGTTETTTSIATIVQGDLMLLSAVYSNSKIKFYRDNVLVATHTTNLPSTSQTSQNIGYFFVNNANTAKFYDWVISSYNFEKVSGFL